MSEAFSLNHCRGEINSAFVLTTTDYPEDFYSVKDQILNAHRDKTC